MKTSAIVVNYNDREHLGPCLRSILASAPPPDEVILVDNGSEDGSVEYVERTFPEVRLILNGANLGYGEASNRGAEEAQGEYLVFVNPDMVAEPGWLTPLVEGLETDPAVGLTTARILLMADPSRVNTCGNEVHYTGLTLCRGLGMKREEFEQPARVSAVSGAAFAIRRELFLSLGGFDPDFFLYLEDTDLSWRTRLAGYRILYVPQSILYHDYALRFGPLKTFYQERNRYLMLLKNLRWGTLLLLLPSLLLAEVVTWGFVLLREPHRWRNKMRAYGDVLRHWSALMQKRRAVQSLRRCRDREILLDHTYRLAFEQTGGGMAARLAHLLFDPLFWLWRWAVVMFLWW